MTTSSRSTPALEKRYSLQTRSSGQALVEARSGVLVLVFGLYVVWTFLWQINRWGGDENRSLIGNALILPVNIWAVFLAFRTSRSPALPSATRRGWAIMGWAFPSNLWGQVAYLALESILHVPPFPSIADVGFLGFYPLMFWGVLSFPRVTKTREERLRFWFDASIILIGCGMVLWHFIVRPVATAEGADPFVDGLSVAYIVGDIVLLFGIATILLRRQDSATQIAHVPCDIGSAQHLCRGRRVRLPGWIPRLPGRRLAGWLLDIRHVPAGRRGSLSESDCSASTANDADVEGSSSPLSWLPI